MRREGEARGGRRKELLLELNSASATSRGQKMGIGLRMARGGRNKNRKQSIVLGISLL
jgi:hypothetical protein